MTHTTTTKQFGRHINLNDAIVGDIRRVLIDAFKTNDLFAARMLTTQWQQRCNDGHSAAARIQPIIGRARRALTRAEAGQSYSFEG
jgi:hypothetical protein